ncbi:MAG: hypothetical protein U0350_35835 [Caldilineaceae bacterium]
MKMQQTTRVKTSKANLHLKESHDSLRHLPSLSTEHPILWLQRTIGNRAIQNLLQTKPKINQPKETGEQNSNSAVETPISISTEAISRQAKKKTSEPSTSIPKQGSASEEAFAANKCTNKVPATKIIREHKIDPTIIQKPGDKVKITVKFACQVRSWRSIIEKTNGESLNLDKPEDNVTNEFRREWDGKKLFPKVGSFLADDGEYRHRLANVKYAFQKSKDMFAEGPKLISPNIKIKMRVFNQSKKASLHATPENVALLARIIESEMGQGNEKEQESIAWAVRNQMIRMGSKSVKEACSQFHDASGKSATDQSKKIAEKILKAAISEDITNGAIKWFSPRSMPKAGENVKGYEISGGLILVTDNSGKPRKVYAPGFHKTMTYIGGITQVREWFVRFYKL